MILFFYPKIRLKRIIYKKKRLKQETRRKDYLKQLRFNNPSEKEGYEKGFKAGYNEGLKKAVLLIQLVASSSEDFEASILQNNKEAIALRKLMIGAE